MQGGGGGGRTGEKMAQRMGLDKSLIRTSPCKHGAGQVPAKTHIFRAAKMGLDKSLLRHIQNGQPGLDKSRKTWCRIPNPKPVNPSSQVLFTIENCRCDGPGLMGAPARNLKPCSRKSFQVLAAL